MPARNDTDLIVLTSIGAIMGVIWFISGFRDLKLKRIIENIPTCKINTGAVGTDVEVKGRIVAEKDRLVTAPISGKPCVVYHLEIQKERRRKNRRSWITIDKFYSGDGFYIDDDSGAAAIVMLDGAKVNRTGKTADYVIRSSEFDSIPVNLANAVAEYTKKKKIKKFKLKETSWFFSGRYRFREWAFAPGEEIYVLGYADSGLKAPRRRKPKMKFFLRAKKMIKENEELQKKFDANQDGKLDYYELERGAQILSEKLADKYSKEKLDELVSKTKMVFKRIKPHPYIISDRTEEELVKSVGTWAAVKIWGGPAVTIGCVAYLVYVFFPAM